MNKIIIDNNISVHYVKLLEESSWYIDSFIFKIKLNNSIIVHMFVERTEIIKYSNIIIIDTPIFLNLWRANPYLQYEVRAISNGNPNTWVKDRKYPEAEKYLLDSSKKPIEIVELSFFRTNQNKTVVSLVDGITRTIWLMSNGCNKLIFTHPKDNESNIEKSVDIKIYDYSFFRNIV